MNEMMIEFILDSSGDRDGGLAWAWALFILVRVSLADIERLVWWSLVVIWLTGSLVVRLIGSLVVRLIGSLVVVGLIGSLIVVGSRAIVGLVGHFVMDDDISVVCW